MGICFKYRGKVKKALILYKESHRIRINIYGSEHIKTLDTMCNIAIIYDYLGHHTKSVILFDEIINTLKLNLQTEHPLFVECI